MNTNDHNNSNPISAQGQADKSADTNTPKQYRASLLLTEYSIAVVTVDANSQAEAEKKAAAIQASEVDYWKSFDSEVWVDGVEAVSKGGSHE
jgi:hypothetical protein